MRLIRGLSLWLILLLPLLVNGQTVSYFNEGFLRQPDAASDRRYLLITNYVAGTNITFSFVSPLTLAINSSGGGGGGGTNFSYTAITNAPWQWGCGNLTNWCLISTNVLGNFDPVGSAQAATNGWPWGVLYQAGCGNLSNWCLFPTNILGTIATNATNYANTIFLVSSNYTTNLVFSTSNALYFVTIGNLLTNNNTWTGTNVYTKNMFVVGPLFVGGTNLGTSCMTVPTAHFGVALYQGGNGAVFIIKENCDMQANLAGCTIANVFTNCGSYNAIEIDGAGLHLASRSTDPIRLYINGSDSGRMDTYQNWLVGTNVNYANDSGHHGSITATNAIYAWNYLKGHRGLIITTNSFSRGTNMAVADPFNNGDLMVASSNGVPYAIAKDQTGVCTTNLMLHVGESATNDWHTSGNSGLTTNGGTFGTLDMSPVNFKINNAAFGKWNTNGSLAIGPNAQATNVGAVAIGTNTLAGGINSAAVGGSASATGAASMAGPASRATGVSSSAFAGGSALNTSALALSDQAIANGVESIAIGKSAASTGNGSVAMGTSTTASGDNSLALVNSSTATGANSLAAGYFCTANNDGSFVWNDSSFSFYSDTAANQFVVYASGGIDLHSAGAGTKTDGPLEVQSETFSTNGYYYSASTNGVAPPPVVIQPLHIWGSLMMTNTNTFNFGANTYGIITNYSLVRTNLMNANKAHGCVTNPVSGYYYCAIHMSAKALDNSAFVEGDVLLNGVPRDEISFQSQFDNPPRYKGMSAFGILYITNNTQITFQLKTSGASGVEISRAQLVVMPP